MTENTNIESVQPETAAPLPNGAVAAPQDAPEINSLAEPSDIDLLGDAYDRAMAGTVDDEGARDGPERGPDGRFVAKDAQDPGQEEIAPAEAAEPQKPEPEAAEQPQTEGTAAPAHLPQAIKADWAKIPETARAAIAAHQAEMDRKFGEVGRQLGEWKPVGERLSAAKQEFPEYFQGVTPEKMAQAAAELAVVQAKLDRDPANTIMQIAQAYGQVDALRAALSGEQPTGEAQHIQHLQQTIRGLEQKIAQLGDPSWVDERVNNAMTMQGTKTLVEQLSSDKPFYAEVEASLPAFIGMAWERLGQDASQKDVFDFAYDMAVNADPAVRAKARASEAKATATAPDPKRTEQARKAASINVKSTSSGGERQLSEIEALSAAFDRAMAN